MTTPTDTPPLLSASTLLSVWDAARKKALRDPQCCDVGGCDCAMVAAVLAVRDAVRARDVAVMLDVIEDVACSDEPAAMPALDRLRARLVERLGGGGG